MALAFNISDALGNLGLSSLDRFKGLAASVTGQSGAPPKASARGWGLYTENGSLLLDFDTMIRIDVDSTNQATQSPVEGGGFVMYNKTVTPTMIDIQAACAGDDTYLGQVSQALLDLSCSTDLINIVLPEIEFKGYNLESVKYTRDLNKAIIFDLGFIEVKQVSAKYSNAKLAKRKNTGKKNGTESLLHGIGDMFS